MPASYRSTSAITAISSGSVALPVPLGTQAGDVLIAMINNSGSSAGSTPGGWNWVTENGTGGDTAAVYYRIATGSEPSTYTWSWSGSALGSGMMISFKDSGGVGTYSIGMTTLPIDSAFVPLNVPGIERIGDNSDIVLLCFTNNAPTTSGSVPFSSWSPAGGAAHIDGMFPTDTSSEFYTGYFVYDLVCPGTGTSTDFSATSEDNAFVIKGMLVELLKSEIVPTLRQVCAVSMY